MMSILLRRKVPTTLIHFEIVVDIILSKKRKIMKIQGKKQTTKKVSTAAYGSTSTKTSGTLFLEKFYIKLFHISCLIHAKCAIACNHGSVWP